MNSYAFFLSFKKKKKKECWGWRHGVDPKQNKLEKGFVAHVKIEIIFWFPKSFLYLMVQFSSFQENIMLTSFWVGTKCTNLYDSINRFSQEMNQPQNVLPKNPPFGLIVMPISKWIKNPNAALIIYFIIFLSSHFHCLKFVHSCNPSSR